ncbi:hypothetical protein RP20_CCG002251 [Aedes albopictus]|nr:hypothetical protein RP20_CCG002251 [Aedes albopictus]
MVVCASFPGFTVFVVKSGSTRTGNDGQQYGKGQKNVPAPIGGSLTEKIISLLIYDPKNCKPKVVVPEPDGSLVGSDGRVHRLPTAEERVCDIFLPPIKKRHGLEENNKLKLKVSALDDDLYEEMSSDDENMEKIVEALKTKEKKNKNSIRIRNGGSKRDCSATGSRKNERIHEEHKERHRDYDRRRERGYE